jgi:chromosomal replication initiator protein
VKEIAQHIWNCAKEDLRHKMTSSAEYDCWIANIVPLSFDGINFELGVQNEFFINWLEDNYQDLILSALEGAIGKAVSIAFVAGHAPEKAQEPVRQAAKQETKLGIKEDFFDDEVADEVNSFADDERLEKHVRKSGLVPKNSFQNFVVGEGNRFAHAASQAVAKSPGTTYNPLFIYGDTGLGKTHLMQSIGQEVLCANIKAVVCYVSCEDYLNEYIDCIQQKKQAEFRKKYRNVDVLLIDDIQFLANKTGTQEEFFHTFNTLFNAHKQIVLVSDQQPHEINGLEKRLVSRFECGQIVDVGSPDYETRLAILHEKQKDNRFQLDESILEFVANNVKSNVRRLEGALIRLSSLASLNGENLTLEQARETLQPILENEVVSAISLDVIKRYVADKYDLRVSDIDGRRRTSNIAEARQVAMYLCRALTNESLPVIGNNFNKNHATVLHATKSIEKKIDEDELFKHRLESFKKELQKSN